MKPFLLFVIALVVSLQCARGENAAGWSSYYNAKRYDFNITYEQLNETPAWTQDAENPPLSARKAIAQARDYLPKVLTDAKQWRLGTLGLTAVGDKDKWVYVVEFLGPHPPGVADGPVPSMKLVVLMNGMCVKPVISDWKLR
jgi:hypothetical protein